MATLELCDLCGGKSKFSLGSIMLRGKLKNYHGSLPVCPDGFKYKEEPLKNAEGHISYQKVWDHYGRVVSETKYITPPKKWKEAEIKYDICESCFDKFCMMLESIKRQNHLQTTEINLIEDRSYSYNPFFKALGYSGDDEDDED